VGGHQAARLVEHEQTGALARRQRLAVDGDDVVRGDVERRRIDDAAIDGDAALHDPFLGVAARGQAGARQHLGDALAGFLLARRTGGALFRLRLALAVFAATAELPDVWRRTLLSSSLSRRGRSPCCLACADAPARSCRPHGTIELRTILARAVETRTVALWPVTARTLVAAFPGTVEFRPLAERTIALRAIAARLVEIARAVAGRTRIAAGMVGRGRIALLPRFCLAAI
jgi:hypothetical protein